MLPPSSPTKPHLQNGRMDSDVSECLQPFGLGAGWMQMDATSRQPWSSFITVDKSTTIAPYMEIRPFPYRRLQDSLNGQYNNHRPSLKHLVKPDGSVSLTHMTQLLVYVQRQPRSYHRCQQPHMNAFYIVNTIRARRISMDSWKMHSISSLVILGEEEGMRKVERWSIRDLQNVYSELDFHLTAMENNIVVHEMTHVITNHMTRAGQCLQTTKAQGPRLGEGWSDAMAEWIQHTNATVPDFVVRNRIGFFLDVYKWKW
ncbi:hypothetical protein JOM56_013771 [Amanita muscaria]